METGGGDSGGHEEAEKRRVGRCVEARGDGGVRGC